MGYDNPDNPLSYAGLAEIVSAAKDRSAAPEDRRRPRIVRSRFLSQISELHVIAFDTSRSAPFGRRIGAHLLRGLKNGLGPDNLRYTEDK